jgi:hypothetical protein
MKIGKCRRNLEKFPTVKFHKNSLQLSSSSYRRTDTHGEANRWFSLRTSQKSWRPSLLNFVHLWASDTLVYSVPLVFVQFLYQICVLLSLIYHTLDSHSQVTRVPTRNSVVLSAIPEFVTSCYIFAYVEHLNATVCIAHGKAPIKGMISK